MQVLQCYRHQNSSKSSPLHLSLKHTRTVAEIRENFRCRDSMIPCDWRVSQINLFTIWLLCDEDIYSDI